MASDDKALLLSAKNKLREFVQLRYPKRMLEAACTFLAASQGIPTWLAAKYEVDNLIQENTVQRPESDA